MCKKAVVVLRSLLKSDWKVGMTLLLEKDEFSCRKHMCSRELGEREGRREESEVGFARLRNDSGARAPSGSPFSAIDSVNPDSIPIYTIFRIRRRIRH